MPLATTPTGVFEVNRRGSNDVASQAKTLGRRIDNVDQLGVTPRPTPAFRVKQWKFDADLNHIRRVTTDYRNRIRSAAAPVETLEEPNHEIRDASPKTKETRIDESDQADDNDHHPEGAIREQTQSVAALIFLEVVALTAIGMLFAMAPAPVSGELVTTLRTLSMVGGAVVILLTLTGWIKR